MNSRERILDSVLYLEKLEKSEGAQADAAALRELDSLMEEVVKFLSYDTPWDEVALLVDKWLGRAAQAGYGEK